MKLNQTKDLSQLCYCLKYANDNFIPRLTRQSDSVLALQWMSKVPSLLSLSPTPHSTAQSTGDVCMYHTVGSVGLQRKVRSVSGLRSICVRTTYGSMNQWMKMKDSATPRTIPTHVPITLTDANWREIKNVRHLVSNSCSHA